MPCPPQEHLLNFGRGKLDPASTTTIVRHLETCVECRKLVGALSHDQGSAFGPTAVPDELANHPDYEVLRELARGGMGIVYLARNRLMDRLEVLKLVSRPLPEKPEASERFQQEIRSAARLAHPNIVTAYSVIRAGDLLVFCMEYVDGQNLAETIKAQGPLDVTRACNFAQQVALGLQHAHEKGMVHRDIKPGNLMLAAGQQPIVKILDFGLAKATSERAHDAGLTKSGQFLGTPEYIAPEQSLDAQNADIRADIYSLGCTLYFLLAGRPPFEGAGLYEILHAHHSLEAQPLNLLRPDVGPELAAVVTKMMAKDPAHRFQQPAEAAGALKPFLRPAARQRPDSKSGQIQPPPLVRPAAVAGVSAPPSIAGLAIPRTIATADQPLTNGRGQPAVQKPSLRRKLWLVAPIVLVAIVGGAAAIIGLKSVPRSEGLVAVEVNEPKPEIFVDGHLVSPAWSENGKHAEIVMTAGARKLELKKDGFQLIAETIEIERGERLTLMARLEPLSQPPANRPDGPAAPPPPASKPAGEHKNQPAIEPASELANQPARASADRLPTDGPPPAITPFDEQQAHEYQQAWATHLGTPVVKTNSIGMKLVLIPPGEFWMGSTAEQIEAVKELARQHHFSVEPSSSTFGSLSHEMPRHRVTIGKAFRMGQVEVTVGEFRRFVDATHYRTTAEVDGRGGQIPREHGGWTHVPEYSWRNPGHVRGERTPVTQVSWHDAQQFCSWLSKKEGRVYRLPTDAQWEYACRSGTETLWSTGDDPARLSDVAWYGGHSGNDLSIVGRKNPNAFQLFDLHGNVWEWCQDGERRYDSDDHADPVGPDNQDRIMRGGGFRLVAELARSGWRWPCSAENRDDTVGFRVVCPPHP